MRAVFHHRQKQHRHPKYFYLSAPSEEDNGAKAVIGNFRVAGFK
jgi:hypothetical protein